MMSSKSASFWESEQPVASTCSPFRRCGTGVLSIQNHVVVRVQLIGRTTKDINAQVKACSRARIHVIKHAITVTVTLGRGATGGVSNLVGRCPIADIVGVNNTVFIRISLCCSATYPVDREPRRGGGALVTVVRDGVAVRIQLCKSATRSINDRSQGRVRAASKASMTLSLSASS